MIKKVHCVLFFLFLRLFTSLLSMFIGRMERSKKEKKYQIILEVRGNTEYFFNETESFQ